MAGSPLVGAPGSRFRAINVYETRSRAGKRLLPAVAGEASTGRCRSG